MKPETRERYLTIARHHIAKAGIDADRDKRGMQKYLRAMAETTTPAYWRRLKTAMAVYAEHNNWGGRWAEDYQQMKNPVTGGQKGRRKALPEACHSRKRCRKVTDAQLDRLREAATPRERAAIEVVALTGCRPAEIERMTVGPDGAIRIYGAKKNEAGSRGLDRILRTDPETAAQLAQWLEQIPEGSAENIRKQISRKTRKLFPKSKYPPTLKSLRHQFGSNLKGAIAAGELTRVQAAYIMGHQSTKSLTAYGNVRSAGGRSKVRPDADQMKVNQMFIRDNYREPPLAPPVAPAPPAPADQGMSYGLK